MEFIWLPSTTFHCNSCLPPQEGTLISSCVCFKMNQTVVEHVVYWLDSMISSTHSDKYNKWQAYSTCWPLCFSMGVSAVWQPAIVKHVHSSLCAWAVTNQWATKNSSTLSLTKMNCSHRCDAPHIFKIVTIFIACKQLVLPNSRASWQWDKHSDYLPCGCCAPSTLAHVFTLSLQWYPHSQTKSLMKGSIDRILCPLT